MLARTLRPRRLSSTVALRGAAGAGADLEAFVACWRVSEGITAARLAYGAALDEESDGDGSD
jgi:hypothetical protein